MTLFNRFNLFNHRPTQYIYHSPGGSAPRLCLDLLNQEHVLIGGTTGSGKSTLIDALIYTILYSSPAEAALVLIDPKRVGLNKYRQLPHTMSYASDIPDAVNALRYVDSLMESRFCDMERRGLTFSDEKRIYVIIDEFASLTAESRECGRLLTRIARLGRAANIKLIIATQCPNRKTITAEIKCNITATVALHCREAIESRQLINRAGAETLPRYGEALYVRPDGEPPHRVKIDMIPADEIAGRIDWWMTKGVKIA